MYLKPLISPRKLLIGPWGGKWLLVSLGLQVLGGQSGGLLRVIDWDLCISVNAGLCELVCDRLLLKILWESLILHMGCELWGPIRGQVWSLKVIELVLLLRVYRLCWWLFGGTYENQWMIPSGTRFCHAVWVTDLGACTDMLVVSARMGAGGGRQWVYVFIYGRRRWALSVAQSRHRIIQKLSLCTCGMITSSQSTLRAAGNGNNVFCYLPCTEYHMA